MVNSDDEGDDTDDGVLGTPSTNPGVASGEGEGRTRTPGPQQDAAQALRARSSPSSHSQDPPVPQQCFTCTSFSARDSATRKRKPSTDSTIAKAGVGHGQLVLTPERLPKVRKADK